MSLDAGSRAVLERATRIAELEAPRANTPDEAEHTPKRIEAITRVCVDEVLSAFGLGGLRRGRRPFEMASRIPARRLARQVATYDAIVGERGLSAGGEWALERMARRVEVVGRENLPPEGALLIVSNHPGLADAVALFAAIRREDLRVIAAKRPFLSVLPNTARRLISVEEDAPGRFGPVRAATRHLKAGGAVLTFPGGKIEPDPAVLPGATEALGRWSSSVDLFARLAPDLTVVPAVVSGVISPTALRNPITYLRRRPEDRRWLAATLQMLWPRLRNVTTHVEFGRPVRAESGERVSPAILEEMRRLISSRELPVNG